ncbi:HEAT repeat-containing protein 6-like [Eriocheir sinensis]|uniref:HEAT repeat-containing protein 6-like n=1 Tax=Eriocheir sinensis TaxID=95602 RepID=UPI0021C57E0B|nr:HEAT repeat-containing protein 6-like [Eriocheir sinensis]
MSEAWQQRWGELVSELLRVRAPPAIGSEEEAALATTLTGLSQCCARPRLLQDHRQIQSVVEKCVTHNIVTPQSGLVRQTALLLVSLLRCPLATHLPSATLVRVVIWLGKALREQGGEGSQPDNVHQLLRALAAALRNTSDLGEEVYLNLAGSHGCLPHILESNPAWHNKALAMQCLHLLTYVGPEVVTEARQRGEEIFPAEAVSSIQRIVIMVVQRDPPSGAQCSHRLYLHLVASSLSVLYNLVVCAPGQVLGNIIITACRPFAFYGLPGYSHGDLVDPCPTPPLELSLSSTQDSDSSSRNYTNRNRRKRLRRKRAQPSCTTADCSRGVAAVASLGGGSAGGMGLGLRGAPPATALANISLKPEWTKGRGKTETESQKRVSPLPSGSEGEEAQGSTSSPAEPQVSGSETDFSDFEGGGEKESGLMARVRQCSLQAINAVIDKVGKQHKFSYWPPLMCQNPSLMTCVLRDPSLSVRMAALQVINTFLLDSSKVLTLAVESEGKTSYTTLGHQLGVSLRELHRCLALALLSEKYPSALVRTLKTIELLVENVNYSKLQPGLLSKLVTHVKYFMRYKEAVVRANAFSVMVSVLMIKPQVEELRDLLLRYQTPTLAAPPAVQPPPSMDEEVPGEEEEEEEVEEGDANLKSEMEKMNLLSEGEEEGKPGEGRSMVSWLVGRCVDSLLAFDHEAVRGIYIQVQLQSLKVLSALVSEHLSLILPSLPLIQRVITVCSEAAWEPSPPPPLPPMHPSHTSAKPSAHQQRRLGEMGDGGDTNFSSPDPGAVVEHTYTLLGCLLGAVKNDLEKKTESSLTLTQAQQLWLWALQGPLQVLLTQAASGHTTDATVKTSAGKGLASERREQANNWRERGEAASGSDSSEGFLKQMVAVATVLSHFNPEVFDSLGEVWAGRVTSTIHWLVVHPETELRLAGVRAMAILVGFPGVVASPGGLALLRATVEATCDLLTQRDANVNRDRLLASWALSNVSSVFEQYRDTWVGNEHNTRSEVLSEAMLERLLEVGLRACQDKDKIRPHGVRCIGNVASFLRPRQVELPTLAPLVARTVSTLVTCASTGNNMKTRWNACHALGNIMASGNFSVAIAPMKGQVFSTLGSLVESFKNYKVRIQACSALCSVGAREAYGTEYLSVWRALLRGLDNAQNIVDFQEIRHRDELINQISQGIWQLCSLLTLTDAGVLSELLHMHQDVASPLMQKAYLSLPPERSGHALQAQHCVEELLGCDALTESQQQALLILESLTSPSNTT